MRFIICGFFFVLIIQTIAGLPDIKTYEILADAPRLCSPNFRQTRVVVISLPGGCLHQGTSMVNF